MKLGIVTDSTADLPAYLIEQHEIQVVPTVLVLEGKEYADGIGITREEFYNQLPALQTPPTTAAPSIGDFLTPYQTLFDSGCDHILSIHAASQLTTIVYVARQAAGEFHGKVTVIDSGSLSMGIGFQVLAAAEASALGVNAGTNADYGNIDGITNIPSGSSSVTISQALGGFNGDLVYHYRLAALNSLGLVHGADHSFQVGVRPTAVTLMPTEITDKSAIFHGTVNPGGRSTRVCFQWDTNTLVSNLTLATNAGNTGAPVNIDIPVTNLAAGSFHFCRIAATNSLGGSLGSTFRFFVPNRTPANLRWAGTASGLMGATWSSVGPLLGPVASALDCPSIR